MWGGGCVGRAVPPPLPPLRWSATVITMMKFRGVFALDGVETPMSIGRVMLRMLDNRAMVGAHQWEGCWPRNPPTGRAGDAGSFPPLNLR